VAKHRPIEDRHSATGWKKYLAGHVNSSPVSEEEGVRLRWIGMEIRKAIARGARLPTRTLKKELLKDERKYDVQFSNSDRPKAKLRPGKFTTSFYIARVRDEISHFVFAGELLRHKKHISEDAHL
jgi:hypothetical protein